MFKVHETSPEDMSNVKRMEWPFKDLDIGQTVEITKRDSEMFTKARVAAHALASHKGWKFSTKTGDNGSLYIQRIK